MVEEGGSVTREMVQQAPVLGPYNSRSHDLKSRAAHCHLFLLLLLFSESILCVPLMITFLSCQKPHFVVSLY